MIHLTGQSATKMISFFLGLLLLLGEPSFLVASASSSRSSSSSSKVSRCSLPTSTTSSTFQRQFTPQNNNPLQRQNTCLLNLRGGSTKTPPEQKRVPPPKKTPEKYQMEQIILLQSRSAKLRQALTDRGLLQDYESIDAPTKPQPVDWECALSTTKNPKRCLISWDAEVDTKVVAPVGSDDWISLTELVNLRRTDPTKVQSLWHDKFDVMGGWFKPSGSSSSTTTTTTSMSSSATPKPSYSMYAHLPWQGHVLALLLDVPLLLNMAVLVIVATILTFTRPIWESMLTLLLTSKFMWLKYTSWAMWVHAALPLKIVMGQYACTGVAHLFSKVEKVIKDYLVQMECQIWEESIPLTIVEKSVEEEEEKLAALLGDTVDAVDAEGDEDGSSDATEDESD